MPADVRQCCTCASMEPSSAEDGDELAQRRDTLPVLASMEPSSAEDGDVEIVAPLTVDIIRFNGAVLSRGRRLSPRSRLLALAQ